MGIPEGFHRSSRAFQGVASEFLEALQRIVGVFQKRFRETLEDLWRLSGDLRSVSWWFRVSKGVSGGFISFSGFSGDLGRRQ